MRRLITLLFVLGMIATGVNAQQRDRNILNEIPVAEMSDEVKASKGGYTLEPLWEYSIHEICNLPAPFGNVSPRGVAIDGENIYFTAINTVEYYKMDMEGNYIGTLPNIEPVGGVQDLNYTNGEFVGTGGSTHMYRFDIEARTLTWDVYADVNQGACAYDETNEVLYTTGSGNSGYDDPIYKLNTDGEVLAMIPRQNGHRYSGLAYDERGPYLWGLSYNTTSKNTLVQISLPSGEETGVVFELPDYFTAVTAGKAAGGMSIFHDEESDDYILTGLVQSRFVWAFNLKADDPQETDMSINSVVAPLSSIGLIGEHPIQLRVKNEGSTDLSGIPVNCTVDGGNPIELTIEETIPAGGYLDVTLPGNVVFDEYGQQRTLVATVDYPGDMNPGNNTQVYVVESIEPYYYIPDGFCGYGDGVYSFRLGDIENLGTGCTNDGYADYTDKNAYLLIGETYTAEVATQGPDQTGYIWIDFNNDKWFDNELELVTAEFPVEDNGQLNPAEITIPEGVEPGIYRMRIIVQWAWGEVSPYPPNAQIDISYGEAEDYTVTITDEFINYDAGVLETTMPSRILPGVINPTAIVKNFGMEEISFDVRAVCGDYNSVVTINNLGSKDTYTVVFDDYEVANGDYDIQFCTELVDDEIPDNDCIDYSFRICDVQREACLMEIGTATWCGFCPGAAMGADDMVANGHDVAIIEYHANDNFQITNGYNRVAYYGITALPTTVFDGTTLYEGGSGSNSIYQQYLPLYEAAMEIPSAYELEVELSHESGGSYNCNVTVKNDAGFEDENLRLFVVLTESHIDFSWQSMDELNFVARGVYPDSEGEPVTFSGSTFNHTESFNVPSSYDLEHCEINVFLQDIETKEVWQAVNTDFTTVGIVQTTNSSTAVYPNPVEDVIRIESSEEIIEVEMYNGAGQRILISAKYDGSLLDMSDFETGVYLLQITTATGRSQHKLIKK